MGSTEKEIQQRKLVHQNVGTKNFPMNHRETKIENTEQSVRVIEHKMRRRNIWEVKFQN